jgi:hypothetical protein
MSRTTRTIVAGLLLVAMVSLALAADPERPKADRAAESAPDPLIVLATARAKAEIAVNAMLAAADPQKSGRNGMHYEVQATYSKIAQILSQAVAAENAKPAENRDTNRIAQANERSGELNVGWQEYNSRFWPDLTAQWNEAASKASYTSSSFTSMVNNEPTWKNAGLDLAAYGTVYQSIAKHAKEITEALKQSVERQNTELATWQGRLQETRTQFGQG